MKPLRPQPFPYAALPAISLEEIRTAKHLREAALAFVDAGAVAGALTELTGETVSLSIRRTRLLDATRVPSDGVAVAFAPADEIGLGRAALVDVEGALAATLVTRALRQRSPRIVDPSRSATSEVAGALAAVLHAVLRRAHMGQALRVVAAGPAPALTRDLASIHGRIATAWLTVIIGSDAFDARVSLPVAELRSAPARAPLSQKALAAMRAAPIALPLVVTTCLAGRTTLAALRPGDVFVVPAFPLTSQAGRLTGRVAIVSGSAERGLAADLGDDGRLMLRSGPLENHSWDQPIGEAMSAEANPTLEVVEDAPVVVRVELGTVEMTAREWASLAPGDVVTLGRKLGDPATLRVGGVEVARGELVQVDGEYGVRILGVAGGHG